MKEKWSQRKKKKSVSRLRFYFPCDDISTWENCFPRLPRLDQQRVYVLCMVIVDYILFMQKRWRLRWNWKGTSTNDKYEGIIHVTNDFRILTVRWFWPLSNCPLIFNYRSFTWMCRTHTVTHPLHMFPTNLWEHMPCVNCIESCIYNISRIISDNCLHVTCTEWIVFYPFFPIHLFVYLINIYWHLLHNFNFFYFFLFFRPFMLR